jgi:hypothetical protein
VERLHRPIGSLVLLAALTFIVSGIVVGVTGDDKPPYNEPTIAVVAWGSMMIAGIVTLVLGVTWWVIAILEERNRARGQ